MRISDWSSDVCSTDLDPARRLSPRAGHLHDTLAKADAAPLGVFLDRIDLAVVARHIFRALAGQRADKTGVVLEVVAPIVKRHALADRKSVVQGKGGAVGVDLGGRRTIKKKTSR